MEPSPAVIGDLADLVQAGQIVEACLTDGTFTALLSELNRRGYAMLPRTAAQQHQAPFLFRVGR